MTRVRLPGGAALPLGERVTSAGEAVLHAVDGRPSLLAKLHFDPDQRRGVRVVLLIRLREWDRWWAPGDRGLPFAWPIAPLLDDARRLCGVLLPRISHAEPLSHLLAPRSRVPWVTRVGVAAELADRFDRLHAAGVVIGDPSDRNVLVRRDGHVTLIDLDDARVAGAPLSPPPKCTSGYGAPETLRDGAMRDRSTDRFGLAILVLRLLMQGDHPFLGRPSDLPAAEIEDWTMDRAVAMGATRFDRSRRIRVPAMATPLDALPADIRLLGERALVAGHGEPRARPSAGEWEAALRDLASRGRPCPRDPVHGIAPGSDACPSCAPPPPPAPGRRRVLERARRWWGR